MYMYMSKVLLNILPLSLLPSLLPSPFFLGTPYKKLRRTDGLELDKLVTKKYCFSNGFWLLFGKAVFWVFLLPFPGKSG